MLVLDDLICNACASQCRSYSHFTFNGIETEIASSLTKVDGAQSEEKGSLLPLPNILMQDLSGADQKKRT